MPEVEQVDGLQFERLDPVWKYRVHHIYRFDLPLGYALKLDGYINYPKPQDGCLFQIAPSRIVAHPGYCWDGPSGPALDTKDFLRASLVHDILCQAIDLGLISPANQKVADKIMREICRQDGMPWLRRLWTYHAVRAYRGPLVKTYDWPRK